MPKIEAKGGKILANAVVYRVETGEKNSIEAVHYFDPDKRSHRVTARLFVIACNGIETPKLLLLSKDERNPNGAQMVYGNLPIGSGRDWARFKGIPFEIKKAAQWIADAKTITIVADATVEPVPFSALFDSGSKRWPWAWNATT